LFHHNTRYTLYLLLGFSIIVLLVACISAANLLLIKGEEQRVETAMRIALGASRFRVIQKAVAESVVLGCIGGLIGLAVSYATAHAVLTLASIDSPYSPIQAVPSLSVTGFTLLIAVIAGTAFGIVPAWITSGNGSLRASATRKVLVITQAGLSTVLIVSAGLLVVSLWKMEHQFFGVELRDRYVVHLNVFGAGYLPDQLAPLYRTLQQKLAAIPGVQGVGLTLCAPLDGFEGTTLHTKIYFQDTGRPSGKAVLNRVGPGFFEATGDRILRGREFLQSDAAISQPVAVVNETFAKTFLPGEDPIGHIFVVGFAHGESTPYQIVGVAADARYLGLKEGPEPTYFRPLLQWQPNVKDPVDEEFETVSAYMTAAVLHTDGPAKHLEADVREVISGVNPQLAIASIHSFDSLVEINFWQERMMAYIAVLFGMMALLLAVVGFYSIARHQRETAMLPASTRTLYRLILLGVASGIPIAFIWAHYMEVQSYMMTPHISIGLISTFVLFMGYIFVEYMMAHRKKSTASELPLEQAVRRNNFTQ
jgi:predicted permease